MRLQRLQRWLRVCVHAQRRGQLCRVKRRTPVPTRAVRAAHAQRPRPGPRPYQEGCFLVVGAEVEPLWSERGGEEEWDGGRVHQGFTP